MPRSSTSSPVSTVEAWWIPPPEETARGVAAHACDADLFAIAESLRHSAAFCDALGRATPVEGDQDRAPA